MKQSTKQRKQFTRLLQDSDVLTQNHYLGIIEEGKRGVDALVGDIGRMIVEAIMEIERTEVVGPEHHPVATSVRRWAAQPGSVYIGDKKVKVQHPRLRDVEQNKERPLHSYGRMKQRGQFSEELLTKVMSGLSERQYEKTVVEASKAFGVSPSSVSRHVVEATAIELKKFRQRDLSKFLAVTLYLDTVHRGGAAFIVALGLDTEGRKMVLGFWEGATENAEICESLLSDLESRGLKLSKKTIFVVDGGKGVQSALKRRYGRNLLIQRCVIHKLRNVQSHLPKKHRDEAKRRFNRALELRSYDDVKEAFMELHTWLNERNESAAKSLLEALEEMLTVYKLGAPDVLRRTLYSTNPIESIFSGVRNGEKNVKRYRGSSMSQRWLGSTLLNAEKGFRRVKGYLDIPGFLQAIDEHFMAAAA